MPYPVSVDVQPAIEGRNRLTTAFRLILAIPHIILVGGAGFGVGYGFSAAVLAGVRLSSQLAGSMRSTEPVGD